MWYKKDNTSRARWAHPAHSASQSEHRKICYILNCLYAEPNIKDGLFHSQSVCRCWIICYAGHTKMADSNLTDSVTYSSPSVVIQPHVNLTKSANLPWLLYNWSIHKQNYVKCSCLWEDKVSSIMQLLILGWNFIPLFILWSSADAATGHHSSVHHHKFIPYRDSVLTWLLKDSLGGNSKTIMIASKLS